MHFQLRTAKEEVLKRTLVKKETEEKKEVEVKKEEFQVEKVKEEVKEEDAVTEEGEKIKPVAHPFDEVMAMLKTGYPLLALSMETMVDQIQLKFKPQADEDMYRLVVALYNEGTQVNLIHFFFLLNVYVSNCWLD